AREPPPSRNFTRRTGTVRSRPEARAVIRTDILQCGCLGTRDTTRPRRCRSRPATPPVVPEGRRTGGRVGRTHGTPEGRIPPSCRLWPVERMMRGQRPFGRDGAITMQQSTMRWLVFATLLVALGTPPPATAVDFSGDYVVTVPGGCRLTVVVTGTAFKA